MKQDNLSKLTQLFQELNIGAEAAKIIRNSDLCKLYERECAGQTESSS